MQTLTADKVEEVFHDCLFNEAESTDNMIVADGILNPYGFHPERLEEHRDTIISLLNELPDNFKQSGGGGWSFLNACMDRHDNQWTGLHRTMDQLFCLGMAIGYVECQLKRELWTILPGGMPYYVIKDKE